MLQAMTFDWERALRQWWFAAVVIAIALLVRMYHIDHPLLDYHAFRQTQTASVTRNFYADGINPFAPRLDVFGVGQAENLILVQTRDGTSSRLAIVTIEFGTIPGVELCFHRRDVIPPIA